jgi:hypothetical protein
MMANDEIILPGQWLPGGPPLALLRPDQEPTLSLDEMFGDIEKSRRIYYERSGRYEGVFRTKEASDSADDYRYVRQYIPGGVLPWEENQP